MHNVVKIFLKEHFGTFVGERYLSRSGLHDPVLISKFGIKTATHNKSFVLSKMGEIKNTQDITCLLYSIVRNKHMPYVYYSFYFFPGPTTLLKAGPTFIKFWNFFP